MTPVVLHHDAIPEFKASTFFLFAGACASHPCLNGGICTNIGPAHKRRALFAALHKQAQFKCKCAANYAGPNCATGGMSQTCSTFCQPGRPCTPPCAAAKCSNCGGVTNAPTWGSNAPTKKPTTQPTKRPTKYPTAAPTRSSAAGLCGKLGEHACAGSSKCGWCIASNYDSGCVPGTSSGAIHPIMSGTTHISNCNKYVLRVPFCHTSRAQSRLATCCADIGRGRIQAAQAARATGTVMAATATATAAAAPRIRVR